MQVDPYKTPELQQSHSFLRTPPSLKSSREIKKSRQLISRNTKCAICDEGITMNLAGERMIELSCGDFCHSLCYYLILPPVATESPICPLCHTETTCMDELLNRKYAIQKLCDPETPTGEDGFVSDITTQMLGKKEYTELEIGLQSYTPESSPTSARRKLDSYMKPIVEIKKCEQNEIDDNEPSPILCSISIKAPEICAANEENKRKKSVSSTGEEVIIQNFVIGSLIQKIAQSTVESLGGLIIFDIFDININGNDIGDSEVYLFENGLIIMQGAQETCILQSSQFFTAVYSSSNEIVLNLKSEKIPEIKLTVEANYFGEYHIEEWKIVEKWLQIFDKIISGEDNLSSYCKFNPITSNGWGMIPTDLRPHLDQIDNEGLQADPIPIDSISTANIILCLSLVNSFTRIDNETYKLKVKSVLYSVISEMRQNDKLGLIFTGINSRGEPCRQSSLMGYADKNWEGWRLIIDEIEVFSNPNVFFDNFEQLALGLKKCQSLLQYVDISEVKVNKLVVFDFIDEHGSEAESRNFEEDSIKLITELGQNISISIVTQSSEVFGHIEKHFRKPVLGSERLTKFSVEIITKELEDIDSSLLTDLYHNVYLPKISIILQGNTFQMHESAIESSELEIIEFNIGEYYEQKFNFKTNCSKSEIIYTLNWLGNNEIVRARIM
ncbi:hypothetical protein CLIB1423_04S06458 [[Candida] railenensis]|uniref:RING-type domain-containing protein n=1 Tax=[Candida] railenensis TaxID=45579 RepID=A0A9P0QNV4_9ASCO|nr:hypothetical protein CLIB1423_04S06458 [[Candida] railenensis]